MAPMVNEHLHAIKDIYSAEIVYEPHLLNTAGTIKKNYDKIQGDQLMLVHADNLSFFDMQEFISAHNARPSKSLMTLMTFRTDSPQSCGIVEVNDEQVVVGFHEKVPNPPGNLANAAVYIMEPEVTEKISTMPGEILDFSLQVIPDLMGRMSVWENKDYHRDIGNPEGFLKSQWEFPCVSEKINRAIASMPTLGIETIDRLAISIRTALMEINNLLTIEIVNQIDDDYVFKSDTIYIAKKGPVGTCSSNIKRLTGATVFVLSLI